MKNEKRKTKNINYYYMVKNIKNNKIPKDIIESAVTELHENKNVSFKDIEKKYKITHGTLTYQYYKRYPKDKIKKKSTSEWISDVVSEKYPDHSTSTETEMTKKSSVVSLKDLGFSFKNAVAVAENNI